MVVVVVHGQVAGIRITEAVWECILEWVEAGIRIMEVVWEGILGWVEVAEDMEDRGSRMIRMLIKVFVRGSFLRFEKDTTMQEMR